MSRRLLMHVCFAFLCTKYMTNRNVTGQTCQMDCRPQTRPQHDHKHVVHLINVAVYLLCFSTYECGTRQQIWVIYRPQILGQTELLQCSL